MRLALTAGLQLALELGVDLLEDGEALQHLGRVRARARVRVKVRARVRVRVRVRVGI